MKPNTKWTISWHSLVAACALAAVATPALAQETPAGTLLPVVADVSYKDGEQPVNVQAKVLPATGYVSRLEVGLPVVGDDVSAVRAYPVVVRNKGNGATSIQLSASTSYGWSVRLVADANKNGLLDADETASVTSIPNVAAGQEGRCLLVVQPTSTSMAAGSQGTVWVQAKDAADANSLAKAPFMTTYSVPMKSRFAFQTGGRLRSSPVVANGLALAGSDEGILWAVRASGASAGTLAWRFPADGDLGAPIVGRVAYDGDGFYFTAAGMVYHLDADGRLVWTSGAGAGTGEVQAMPLVTENTVTVAGADGRVRRLDKQDGRLLETSRPLGDGPLSTPALPRTGEIWLGGSDGTLYSLSDGNGYTVHAAYRIGRAGKSVTPFVDSRNGNVMTVSDEGSVYSLSHRGQKTLWGPVALGSSVTGAPWVDSEQGTAYFAGTDNTLHALYTANGATVPGYPVALPGTGGFVGAPVVVPLPDGKRVVYLASTNGRVYAVNAGDPFRYRIFDTGQAAGQFLGSPALSGATYDDVVVTASTDGALYGFTIRDTIS